MATSSSVEAYLYSQYFHRFSEPMDEMKMHKLMYFSQRESLMLYEKLLFDENFFGWKYGPVLKSVRSEYHSHKDDPYKNVGYDLTERERNLLDSVLNRYAGLSSWKLSSLSHAEFSWKRSRKGLESGDKGDVALDLNAMKVDAAREKAFRKKQVV